ncbi:MAG: archease [Elusimicrobia bacterium]|nr:archease [Elusimicrobiota bacterium]
MTPITIKKKKKVKINRFKIINHTADVGIIVTGKTIKKLFENAAFGMFSLITPLKKVQKKISISVSIKSNNYEELLVAFLNELQYYYAVKKLLFKDFKISKITKTHLNANVSGEKISKHEILHDIKAATYHNLKIDKTLIGFQTQIIFDV